MFPNRIALAVVVVLAGFVFSPRQGQAQLTVQQPVFGVNSVGTTVSVPDRGTAHLGSISSARSGSKTFGPLPSGTNYGFDRQHTGMSVNVYIHDFEAMDRYLLGQAPAAPAANPQLTGNARHAWSQLQAEHGPVFPQRLPDPQTLSKAEKYWRLGQARSRKANSRSPACITGLRASSARTPPRPGWLNSKPPAAIPRSPTAKLPEAFPCSSTLTSGRSGTGRPILPAGRDRTRFASAGPLRRRTESGIAR